MKINENVILNMVIPHTAYNTLAVDAFDNLFSMLSRDEKNRVTDFLASQGIELVDMDDNMAQDFVTEFTVDNSAFGGNDPLAFSAIEKKGNGRMNELLAKAAQAGNKDAMDLLFRDNERLVWDVVRKYTGMCGTCLTEEDLFQAGALGMMKAVERFNYDLGWKFTTYAEWWIRQAITREIANYGYTIRIPVHKQDQIRKVNRVYNDLHRNGIPSVDGVARTAEATGLSESVVLECLQLREYVMGCTSLDTPIGEDNDSVLRDFVPADDSNNPENLLELICLKSDLQEILDTLTPREEKVIRLRFGLDDGHEWTLEEVGKEFNVTRERIRQIEAKAMRKLRHPSRSKMLKDWLEVA